MDATIRYFDQGMTRAELDQLGEQLLDDQGLAIEFARAARLDHALEETFTAQARTAELGELVAMLEKQGTPPNAIPRTAALTLAAAAAVALCGAIFLLWPRDRSADPPNSADARPAEKRIHRPSIHLPQTRLTAILPRERGSDAEAEALLRQRLSRFYLPATNIDQLPLDEALASLQQSFHSIDRLSGGSGDAIAFELAGNIDELPAVSLSRSNISVLSALELLALQTRCELVFAPPTVRLTPAADPADGARADSGLLTVTYQVSPALFASGPYRDPPIAHPSPDGSLILTPPVDGNVRIWDLETGEVMAGLPRPPGVEAARFSADGGLVEVLAPDGSVIRVMETEAGQPAPGSPGQVWAAAKSELQTSWGLELTDAESGTYSPSTGELVLRSSQANRDRFSALLSEATGSSASSSPITITTKLISFPIEMPADADRIVNPDEWQRTLRDWTAQRGVDLLSAPTITAHIGQEVSAEIATYRSVEVNQEGGEDVGGITVEGRTGLRLPFTTSATGEQITVAGSIDQSMAEADLAPEVLDRLGGSDPDSPLVHFITEVEAPLFPGQVALFECESHEPGRRLLASVSVDWGPKQHTPSATESEPTPDAEE